MSGLPIPDIQHIREIYKTEPYNCWWFRFEAWICPDPMAGRKNRYSVVRVDRVRGEIQTIGRELDLTTSRAVARRDRARDGQPLTDEEIRVGRRPWTSWSDLNHRVKIVRRR